MSLNISLDEKILQFKEAKLKNTISLSFSYFLTWLSSLGSSVVSWLLVPLTDKI